MIQERLLKLQKEWVALKKDASNPFFKSKYITLDNIIETYNPLLTELGIVCYHYTKDNKLTTTLFDIEDKTFIESEFNIYNNDPQKQGSEITYWKRYNLWQLLNIQTDTDDDWNIASAWWNTKQFYKKETEVNKDLPKHTCRKCWAVVWAEIFTWNYWPCFKCSECWNYSKPNPFYENWENDAKSPDWDINWPNK